MDLRQDNDALPISRLHKLDKAYASLQAQMARLLAARKAEIASDPEFISAQKNRKIDAREVPEANEKDSSMVGGMGYRRSDILSRLVIASETEGNKGLRDEELVSYIFVH